MAHAAGGLLLLTSALSAPGTWATPTPVPLDETSALAAVRADARGTVEVTRDSITGRITFLDVDGDSADLAPSASSPSARSSRPELKAAGWLDEHATVFGVSRDDLVLDSEIADSHGLTLTYSQQHDGVPVWGAALKANLDPEGRLTSVNGRLVPEVGVDTTPTTTPTVAAARAVEMVRQDPPTDEDGEPAETSGLDGVATLVVYETGSPQGRTGIVQLAWDVTVTGGGLNERVILSDRGSKPLNRWSDTHGLTRVLDSYTGNNGTSTVADDPFVRTWSEGQSRDALSATQRNMLDSTGETYHFFNTSFGRDSWDGAGATMTLRDNRSSGCPNASWYMGSTSFCPGMTSDDIVGHEWGHAYTQTTSGLNYQYQSGALNESYSDVWGETIDLLNAREDEGEDLTPRADDSCLASTVTVRIAAPRSSAGSCALMAIGPDRLKLVGERTVSVVNALDQANVTGPSTIDACTPLTNAAAVAGRWVYADRGPCTFQVKADNVVAAGGKGLIVANTSTYATAITSLSLTSPIPVILLSRADGEKFKRIGSNTVEATPKVVIAGSSSVGRRWMISEQSSAFTQPLRDMWNPTCMGEPAKVTDAEYHCAESDNGGVHFNSGVPNRAYSLFVDGGTFNGTTVTGVGLDRAAHVWWRAGSAHLVPTSSFMDFADALEASCQSLVGASLTPLSTSEAPGTTPVAPLTSSDCASLTAVIAATELRTDPGPQCNWTPFWQPGAPASPCGDGTQTVTGLAEDFEDAEGWTDSTTGAAVAWTLTDSLRNSQGRAAFAATPNPSCATSAAGRATLVSPTVTVSGGALSPRLSLRHLVALEALYDGANVKLSIDGGAWTPPPAQAWLHNGPTGAIQDWGAANRTDNPMRLERAWYGGDLLNPTRVWGTSVLDLAAAGVSPGSTVALRFDVGTDLCFGVFGWGIDDVSITWCEEPATAPAQASAPLPSTSPEIEGPVEGESEVEVAPEAPGSIPTATLGRTRTAVAVSHAGRTTTSVKRGRAFTLTATVRSARPGAAPVTNGRVRFMIGGRNVGSAPVVNGRARLTVSAKTSRSLKPGRRAVKASFLGGRDAASSSTRSALRLRR